MSNLVEKDLNAVIVFNEGSIQFKNFKELEKMVIDSLKQYEGIVLNDDNKQDIKKIMAELNKTKKAIDDERKRVEREYTKPLELLKDQVKSLISTIDNARNKLDTQVKEDDEIRRNERISLLTDYYNINKVGNMGFITFDDIGLNITLSASETSLKKQIDEFIEKIQLDLEEINTDVNAQRLLAKYRLSKNLQLSRIELNKELAEEAKVVVETPIEKPIPTTPAVDPTADEVVSVDFSVTGTRAKIRDLRDYMEKVGLHYE